MKLTKSQRLFIQAGRIESYLERIKAFYRHDKKYSTWVEWDAKEFKQLKEERKKLIREAVRASNEELEKGHSILRRLWLRNI